MSDDLDKAFAGDLEKLGKKRLPLEMQVNQAKVKAAQTPAPGAEKPDLGAPGKKIEKKASLDEQYDAHMRQAVGLDVAESAPDFEHPDVHVAGQSTDRIDDSYIGWMQEKSDEDVVTVDKEAMDYRKAGREAAQGTVSGAEKILRSASRQGAAKGAAAATATLATGAALYSAHKKRQASKGPTGGEKTAGVIDKVREIEKEHARQGAEMKKKKKPSGVIAKMKMYNREHTRQGAEKKAELEKEAGVNAPQENLDLMERIKKRAAHGLPLQGDV